MNEYWANHVKESNEDLGTNRVREDIQLSLTDKQESKLTRMALKAGFKSPSELIESFIGDLTKWHDNGSDERHLAEGWYKRAFGGTTTFYAFFRYHCYDYNYAMDDLIEALENEDLFNEFYNEYVEENSWDKNINLESKEECRKVIEELTAKERAQIAEAKKKGFDLVNQDKYEK